MLPSEESSWKHCRIVRIATMQRFLDRVVAALVVMRYQARRENIEKQRNKERGPAAERCQIIEVNLFTPPVFSHQEG